VRRSTSEWLPLHRFTGEPTTSASFCGAYQEILATRTTVRRVAECSLCERDEPENFWIEKHPRITVRDMLADVQYFPTISIAACRLSSARSRQLVKPNEGMRILNQYTKVSTEHLSR